MSQITLYGFNFERPRFLTVRSLDEQRVMVMWDNPVEGGKIGRSDVGLFHIGSNGADTLSVFLFRERFILCGCVSG